MLGCKSWQNKRTIVRERRGCSRGTGERQGGRVQERGDSCACFGFCEKQMDTLQPHFVFKKLLNMYLCPSLGLTLFTIQLWMLSSESQVSHPWILVNSEDVNGL